MSDQEAAEGHDEQQEQPVFLPAPDTSLRSIEYDPALLQYTDPFSSMKSDVYTDVVPTTKRFSLAPGSPLDPLQVMCDTMFAILKSSVQPKSIHRSTSPSATATDELPDLSVLTQFPYFDVYLETADRTFVPANQIFLVRCPKGTEILRCVEKCVFPVSLKEDVLLKVLSVLYSTDLHWMQLSELCPDEYSEIVQVFGNTDKTSDNFTTLSDHLESFACSRLLSDAWMRSGNFRAPVHKVVMCGRSEYFTKAFSPYFLSSRTGETVLKDASSPVLVALLDYLYSGKLDQATSLEVVVDMLTVANEIQDETLCEACCQTIGSNIDLDNCSSLYTISMRLLRPELQWFCTQFFLDHYDSLSPSLPGYKDLPPGAVEEFDLIREILILNPVGRGRTFGAIREVIATLKEAQCSMVERLEEAKDAHAQAVKNGISDKAIDFSRSKLSRQEERVKKLIHFLTVATWRYHRLLNHETCGDYYNYHAIK